MNRKTLIFMMIILISMVMLSGCGLIFNTQDQSAAETLAMIYAQSTLTKIAVDTQIADLQTQAVPTETSAPEPTATSTLQPTIAVPTLTSMPLPTNTVAPPSVPETRLEFQPNATNVSAMGTVPANRTIRYVFRAFASQLIDVSITSGQESAISISGRDGTVLLSAMGDSQSYRGYLPSTQDWFIDIRAGAADANFGLYLMIPERVTFTAGTHMVSFPDNVPAGGVHNYVVYALAGQQMSVSATPAGNVALSVWGVDGTVLMSGMGESNTFNGSLPITQDWIINVRSAPGTGTRNYTFTVDIQ